MAVNSGTIYDGTLTVYDAGTRTSAGFFTVVDATASAWTFQMTVSGLTSGNIDFDFDGSLDGINWGHIVVSTKNNTGQTVNANGTTIFYVNGTPCRYVRVHVVSMPAGPTISCLVGAI